MGKSTDLNLYIFFCSYLRAVAYREFTRLIHEILGRQRIPLPACVYTAIRRTFQTDEELVGFLDED